MLTIDARRCLAASDMLSGLGVTFQTVLTKTRAETVWLCSFPSSLSPLLFSALSFYPRTRQFRHSLWTAERGRVWVMAAFFSLSLAVQSCTHVWHFWTSTWTSVFFFFFNSPVVPAFFKPTFARCAVALNDIFVVALCWWHFSLDLLIISRVVMPHWSSFALLSCIQISLWPERAQAVRTEGVLCANIWACS